MAPPRLLLRTAIQEGESLKGYLMRLALLNGYRNLGWLLYAAGVHPATLDQGTAPLDGLAAMTGRDVCELEAIYWPASVIHRSRPSQHRLTHTTIPAWLLNVRHPRICPHCIREGRPPQRTWEIAWASCCPRHGIYLVNRCGRCTKPISWNRPWLHRCDCGFGLPALPASKASPAEIALSALLGERFASDPATGSYQALPAWFYTLPSSELPSFLLKLSALEIGSKAPQQLSSMCLDVDAAKSLTLWLADLLSKWPASIFTHLDQAMASLNEATKFQGQSVRIRDAVQGLLTADAPAETRKTLAAWIHTSRNQLWPHRKGWLSEQTSENPSYSAEKLRTSLDLGKQAFAYAISTITASTQSCAVSSNTLSPPQLQELEQLVAQWRSSLSEMEAAHKLGLPNRDIGSLVRAGLLTPESIPWDGYKFSKRFDGRQLDQLVSQILAMTTPASEPISPNLSDLATIRTQFGRRAFVGHLVVSILSGKLKCYRLPQGGPLGLSQIRLDIREIEAHLHLGLQHRAAKRPHT